MISVSDALDHLFALVRVLPAEHVPLRVAAGRVLAETVRATRTQPPFAASAMDGYAINRAGLRTGATYRIIGEAAAGHRFAGNVGNAEAVRIFTGAPVPDGADCIVIQEDVDREGDTITLRDNRDSKSHIRAAGQDFQVGDPIEAPCILNPSDVALLAAMNVPRVPVARKPSVAIIPTGDELVQPGETPGPDQIIASNSYGLAALLEANGANPRLLPIARDTTASLALAFNLAKDADLIITIGGASVGDHDLVGEAAAQGGMQQAFYKVAMRPGKPLMAGRIGSAMMVGLPGNPVSAMVCGHVFVVPVIRAMLGLPAQPAQRKSVTLVHDIDANGPREHYMRGHVTAEGLTIFERQDSALLRVLANANCLAIRPAHDGPRMQGDMLDIIMI
ncbi:molybdopterin molybdotransferase [Cognatiyoonia koreensis]|uniref:Molybdopterin molybdenumtransferase n=1 Tax=Cognatiyoonia koreensis TaxID=364200 RepID=A0A1I0PKG0_9RHOB|nr:gephyrin-like molybdotransferase Glp [Cognatiyoonia koreensis]SEW14849.1 molybdopterin molybdotransferase [Cognatiyoonia koreensis]